MHHIKPLSEYKVLARMVQRIVSGGQTGADRAALDWAMQHGIPHGGWCPHGRRAEDGRIADRYLLQETESPDYAQRTAWNVRDADGTVIFSLTPNLGEGSELTRRMAEQYHKPHLHLHPGSAQPAATLLRFLHEHDIRVLNIAGPRASTEPAVGAFVTEVLDAALG